MDWVEIVIRVIELLGKLYVVGWNLADKIKPNKVQKMHPFNYTLPHFNVLANLWTTNHRPIDGPPDVEDYLVQLYHNSRASFDVNPGDKGTYVPALFLRYPKEGPVGRIYYAEVPAGSGEYYRVRWTTRIHLGFPNEYLQASVEIVCPNGTPQFFPGSEDECTISGEAAVDIGIEIGCVAFGESVTEPFGTGELSAELEIEIGCVGIGGEPVPATEWVWHDNEEFIWTAPYDGDYLFELTGAGSIGEASPGDVGVGTGNGGGGGGGGAFTWATVSLIAGQSIEIIIDDSTDGGVGVSVEDLDFASFFASADNGSVGVSGSGGVGGSYFGWVDGFGGGDGGDGIVDAGEPDFAGGGQGGGSANNVGNGINGANQVSGVGGFGSGFGGNGGNGSDSGTGTPGGSSGSGNGGGGGGGDVVSREGGNGGYPTVKITFIGE